VSRPRVLVLEAELGLRLRWIAALSEVVDARGPADAGPPLREVRRDRVPWVLLGLGRGQLADGLQLCRQLRTDREPPGVGLIDPWDRLGADAALRLHGAQGYLGGDPDPAQLRAFVSALVGGEQPLVRVPARRGLLARLLRPAAGKT
jgi:hypothetical protein